MSRLKNKTALITGAAQGIGRATALKFIEEGASVIACDINPEGLQALKDECGCKTRVLDLRDGAAIEKLAKEIQSLDILFNCAGFVHSGTIEGCGEADWDLSMDLNVKAMYRMIRALLPVLKQSGSASIINMSSVASSIIGVPNRFVYGVSKAAVIGITKAVAVDFVKEGVRCNAICPGTVETPSLNERLKATGNYEKARSDFIERQPMGRLGQAEEIAALALYLASDESAFTTGTTQVIDGGWTVA